jgi:hypothetical protein
MMENRLFAFIDFEYNAMPALFLHKGPKMTRNKAGAPVHRPETPAFGEWQ